MVKTFADEKNMSMYTKNWNNFNRGNCLNKV